MINLLPSSFRAKIRQEENMRLLVILLALLFLFLLSLSFLLGSLRIYLGGEIKTQEARIVMQRGTLEGQEEQEVIKNLNRDISNTIRLYRKQVQLGAVFKHFASDLPNRMILENFSYTPVSEVLVKEEVKNIPAKLTVSGFAPTREILFSFKESLEEDSLFVNVTFPPSNWVNATDIIFSVSLELAP